MSCGELRCTKYRFGMDPTNPAGPSGERTMVTKSGNPAIDSVADQARSAVDRVADSAAGVVNTAKATMHDKVNAVADRANTAAQWASDKVDAAKQAPTDAIETGAEYIRARPYVAVCAALAIGYVIGKLR
jgi:ElaB/YqjD/DUF883 family membrane-anchored ribosome-binding protein